jgi:hypothetical protein
LSFHEIPGPTDCWHEVIVAHNFGLHQTSGVELLLSWAHNGKSCPKDSPPPECPLMLRWTSNDATTHHFRMLLPLALRISGSVRVPLRYFIKSTNLFQSHPCRVLALSSSRMQ